MPRTTSNAQAVRFPALHVSAIRTGLALAIAASLLAFGLRVEAQQADSTVPSMTPSAQH